MYGESETVNVGKDVWNYVPSGKRGARLPHAWLHLAFSGAQESILDKIPYNKFVVLYRGEYWKNIARNASGEQCLFLDVAELGADQHSKVGNKWSSHAARMLFWYGLTSIF